MAVDPVLAALNLAGFNLLQQPEVRVSPLDVLGRDDVLEQVGPLTTLFTSANPFPSVAGPTPSPEFSGQETELIHVEVGERILVRLLNGLGSFVDLGMLRRPPRDIRFVRFSFDEVEIVSAASQDIAAYLFTAQPVAGPLRDRYLDNAEADAYVITQVIRARSIRVLPLDAGSAPVSVSIPPLVASGDNLAVSIEGDWIRFRGEGAATMAFRCFRITLAGGKWGLEGDMGEPVLIAPGTRLMVTRGPGALAS